MIGLPELRKIFVVTDKQDTLELTRLMLASLPDEAKAYPQVTGFMHAELEELKSVDLAMQALERLEAESAPPPKLIIVDALVRRGSEPTPGNGAATTQFLRLLERKGGAIPVLVISPGSIERLDHEVLGRRNVALWDLTPNRVTFAQSLCALASPAIRHQRRITIEVGRNSARYHIDDGNRKITTDRAYLNLSALDSLLRMTDRFSPYDNPNWQDVLGSFGMNLFRLLLEDELGPTVFEGLEEMRRDDGTSDADIDFRFEIDLSDPAAEGLFELPFEVVNHDLKPSSFLCARVPMARRIRWSTGRAENSATPPKPELRALFVNAGMGGHVTVMHEDTGAPVVYALEHVRNTVEEQKLLRDFPVSPASRLKEKPTILSASRYKGRKLRDRIRDELTSGAYDIFHFSGHSVTVKGGGTFIVLPDDKGGALPVSVRELAAWVKQGGCRLVVLSSCRGSSLRTAIEAMQAGAEAVLGFRWDVDDAVCVDYFERFYDAFLNKRKSLSAAYRDACRSVQTSARGVPLWASAVAVVRD